MGRLCFSALLFVAVAGCASPERASLTPDQERAALTPLFEDGKPLPYADLIGRARLQVAIANEAFYLDNWSEVQRAADALKQTAQLLKKAADPPAAIKDRLRIDSEDLEKEAIQLHDAAGGKQKQPVTDAFKLLHSKVREMSPPN